MSKSKSIRLQKEDRVKTAKRDKAVAQREKARGDRQDPVSQATYDRAIARYDETIERNS